MFKNHPKGLIPAALANMGERFGYYIMNAVLLLFLISKFGLPDEQGSLIYSLFYAGIYVLSLVGGFIADRLKNYKGTIQTGLVIMATGYILLSIPILATNQNHIWLLTYTCVALFFIAFGNGLFKGNLQAIVGQMYDNFEKEAALKGEEALKEAKARRNPGFQIFYVFINVGGLIAPFVAPLLRSWWLSKKALIYIAELPELCHKYITFGQNMVSSNASAEQIQNSSKLYDNLIQFTEKVSGSAINEAEQLHTFCSKYLDVYNTGVHYSFIASVIAMLISLVIFLSYKKMFPNPVKVKKEIVNYSKEEKLQMAKEIKQRIYALFAVLGIAVFFWFAFHQNGTSLSLFAKDFVITSKIPPEIWQAINPFFVILLTPVIIWIFSRMKDKGNEPSTPKKIAIGMGIAGIAFLFMAIISYMNNYPSANEFRGIAEATREVQKTGPWVLFVLYFFLTVAELFISPLGISFVSKVAPKHLLGLCQGLWLGATAVGNGLLWIGPLLYNKYPIWICWTVFLVLCAVSMIVMLGMVKWLERVTK
ncbi:MAG: peptide MFS transporter [Bacteroidales bacterium]|jgi:POT family proton-dependent oligopeptide transporter|nr:peptide MFS transporter [Bacteroidales bacterium]